MELLDSSRADLETLRRELQLSATAFLDAYGDEVEVYRAEISAGISESLARLQQSLADISGADKTCVQLGEQIAEYVNWLQWSLWDMPYLAAVLRPPAGRFRKAAAACGLVYLSLRVFDDVIDRHFWYKGKHPTLLGATSTTFPSSRGTEGLTLLGGLLLCFEGLSSLADPEQHELAGMLRPVVDSIRRAVIGAIMEHSQPDDWSRDYYDRLVELKNVDYWRALYSALDPGRQSPLYPFLESYYTLAQHLNDVQDFAEDVGRDQPNLLSLYLPVQGREQTIRLPRDGTPARQVPEEVEQLFRERFFDLARIADGLPEPDCMVARLKLAESLQEAERLGVFSGDSAAHYGTLDGQTPAPPMPPLPPPAPLGLHWYSQAGEVVASLGSEALEKVDCPVCGGRERNYLFHKQGFAYHRCEECSHIYVSPRIHPEAGQKVFYESDVLDPEDAFLQVQKIYATPICHLLRSRAPGSRLLDLGFGHGYLMQMAQAYGFEVFGVDGSKAAVDALKPQFGQHVVASLLGDDLPWGQFDVVVMSHIVEHLPYPADTLPRVLASMNKGAILYVAVPDMESLQFRIFGKKWEVVNPMVHYQYFTEGSLTRLLLRCGFTGLERIHHAAVPAEFAPRWMHLFRKLGGTDAGELAILAVAGEGE
ncbi:MAG: class I SAM-dependent methyltransferase [Chloroflexota bacterium]|nr:class I SAM-dependent methyltransferase [Chloroflexota bacterium]